jgi:hypothetical protein
MTELGISSWCQLFFFFGLYTEFLVCEYESNAYVIRDAPLVEGWCIIASRDDRKPFVIRKRVHRIWFHGLTRVSKTCSWYFEEMKQEVYVWVRDSVQYQFLNCLNLNCMNIPWRYHLRDAKTNTRGNVFRDNSQPSGKIEQHSNSNKIGGYNNHRGAETTLTEDSEHPETIKSLDNHANNR